MTPDIVERLSDGQLSAVLGLVRIATRADGVGPLSEQVLLAARDRHAGTGSTSTSWHFLAYAGPELAGYAHLGHGEAATAEIVVDPSYRRRGIGTELIHALELAAAPPTRRGGTLQVWSHGDLDGARAFALRHGYSMQRELWQMRRSLRPDAAPLPAVSLPAGFAARPFVVGRDEAAWQEVNARAFVSHPEQGRMTRDDLVRRIAEPWFDAEGFILVEDRRGPAPVLAASHWTKVTPPEDPQSRPAEGEVYVVGVDPAYQGLGIGRTITILGLVHLRDRGLTRAMLYVDADNSAAVATYSRLDFAQFAVDIMYSRIVHTPM
jgi:mycothiol synthase